MNRRALVLEFEGDTLAAKRVGLWFGLERLNYMGSSSSPYTFR